MCRGFESLLRYQSPVIAHTCIEATVRCAAGLGHDITVVKDATADYSDEEMTPLLTSISRTKPVPS